MIEDDFSNFSTISGTQIILVLGTDIVFLIIKPVFAIAIPFLTMHMHGFIPFIRIKNAVANREVLKLWAWAKGSGKEESERRTLNIERPTLKCGKGQCRIKLFICLKIDPGTHRPA